MLYYIFCGIMVLAIVVNILGFVYLDLVVNLDGLFLLDYIFYFLIMVTLLYYYLSNYKCRIKIFFNLYNIYILYIKLINKHIKLQL